MAWIQRAKDRHQWRYLVKTEINVQVPWNAEFIEQMRECLLFTKTVAPHRPFRALSGDMQQNSLSPFFSESHEHTKYQACRSCNASFLDNASQQSSTLTTEEYLHRTQKVLFAHFNTSCPITSSNRDYI